MNSHQRKIYSSQIKHGLEWKRHKYLYKDANGNYVYPEDVKNNAKSKVRGFIADQKQKSKDRKFVKDISKYREKEAINARKYGGPGSAHQGAMHEHYWDHGGLDHTTPAEGAKSLKKQKQKTKQRKEEAANKAFLAERKKINQQRKSAHMGYEEDRKNFPDGGSTEELEIQKKNTANRKKAKEQSKKRAQKLNLDRIKNNGAQIVEDKQNADFNRQNRNRRINTGVNYLGTNEKGKDTSKDDSIRRGDQIHSAHQNSTSRNALDSSDHKYQYHYLDYRRTNAKTNLEKQIEKTPERRKAKRRRQLTGQR